MYFDNNDFPIKTWRMTELVQQVQYGADFNILKLWLDTYEAVDEYYLAFHDKDEKDGVPVEPHIHCFVKFKSPRTSQTILNMVNNAFGDNLEKPIYRFEHMSKIKNGWASAVAYGSHMNAPEKYPYFSDKDFVVATNIAAVDELVSQGVAPIKNKRLREIESYIQKGLVTSENLYVNRYLTSADFLNHQRKIEVLLDFYQQRNAKIAVIIRDITSSYNGVLSAHDSCLDYADQIVQVDKSISEAESHKLVSLQSTRRKFIERFTAQRQRLSHCLSTFNKHLASISLIDKSVLMASEYADFELPSVSEDYIEEVNKIAADLGII